MWHYFHPAKNNRTATGHREKKRERGPISACHVHESTVHSNTPEYFYLRPLSKSKSVEEKCHSLSTRLSDAPTRRGSTLWLIILSPFFTDRISNLLEARVSFASRQRTSGFLQATGRRDPWYSKPFLKKTISIIRYPDLAHSHSHSRVISRKYDPQAISMWRPSKSISIRRGVKKSVLTAHSNGQRRSTDEAPTLKLIKKKRRKKKISFYGSIPKSHTQSNNHKKKPIQKSDRPKANVRSVLKAPPETFSLFLFFFFNCFFFFFHPHFVPTNQHQHPINHSIHRKERRREKIPFLISVRDSRNIHVWRIFTKNETTRRRYQAYIVHSSLRLKAWAY